MDYWPVICGIRKQPNAWISVGAFRSQTRKPDFLSTVRKTALLIVYCKSLQSWVVFSATANAQWITKPRFWMSAVPTVSPSINSFFSYLNTVSTLVCADVAYVWAMVHRHVWTSRKRCSECSTLFACTTVHLRLIVEVFYLSYLNAFMNRFYTKLHSIIWMNYLYCMIPLDWNFRCQRFINHF